MVSVILGHTVLLIFFVCVTLLKKNNQICFKEKSVLKNEKNNHENCIWYFCPLKDDGPIQDFAHLRRNPRICYEYYCRNYVH